MSVTISEYAANLKKKYGEGIKLEPSGMEVLMGLLKNNRVNMPKVGERFQIAATLGLDHSTTFHGQDDSVIDLEPIVSGNVGTASVIPSAMTFPGLITKMALDRMSGGADSFWDAGDLSFERSIESFTKVMEVVHNHGGNGIGTFTYATADGSDITIDAAEWATAIWIGGLKMPIDIYNAAGSKVLSTTVTNVNTSTRELTLASVSGLSNGTAYTIYKKGAKGKESLGLFNILKASSGSLFGLSIADNDLWGANQKALGSSVFDWSTFASAVAEFSGRGVTNGDYRLLMNTIHFPKMVPDFNTAKSGAKTANGAGFPANHSAIFQGPGAVTKIDFGTDSLKFHINNTKAEIVTSEYCKRGEAALIDLDCFMKVVGTKQGDMEMQQLNPGASGDDQYFRLLENSQAYAWRLYADQALFCPELNKQIYFSGLDSDAL